MKDNGWANMKGEFFVHQIDDEIYSTNSLFWACFFTDKPMPGSEKQKGDNIPIDFDVVTYNGEIIYKFKETA